VPGAASLPTELRAESRPKLEETGELIPSFVLKTVNDKHTPNRAIDQLSEMGDRNGVQIKDIFEPRYSLDRVQMTAPVLWNYSPGGQPPNVSHSLVGRDTMNTRHHVQLGDGWTIEQDNIEESIGIKLVTSTPNDASYAPGIRLLTSYNPIVKPGTVGPDPSRGESLTDNQIVGATISRDQTNPPVRSVSAYDAIKMHDQLLEKPPRDGKVRVRMYYHRAMHDDARLYGNGPWKYWGHGWGLEFGFDPRSNSRDNFYQKGYTIERAFGRDFCRHGQPCREPDPDFFKDPQKAGTYTIQYAKSLKSTPTPRNKNSITG